ncbi:MAG: hypothetical protein HY985_03170 [Magnetospirillum sp.]|nr:hypothetical protein [Magnetospirillum sp.]
MSRKREREGLFARLTRPIRAAARRVVGGGDRPGPSRSAPAGAAAAEESEDAFTLALQQIHREDTGRFQTKLQVVSLIEFREAVGAAKWARVSEKVMLIAEGVIHLHLGAGNTFGRQGNDFFVLVFRSGPAEEGRRRALMIAQDLGTRLVGDQFQGLERPLALAAEVDAETAINADGTLNLAAIHAAVGEMRSLLAGSDEDGPPVRHSRLPGQAVAEPGGGLRRHLMPGERPAARDPEIRHSMLPGELPRSDPQVLRRSLLPGDGGGGEEAAVDLGPDPAWQAIERARRPKTEPAWEVVERPAVKVGDELALPDPAAAALAFAEAEGAPPLPAEAAVSVLWRPTWFAIGEAIAVYKAHVHRVDRPGEAPREGCRAYPRAGTGVLALDRAAVAAAVREMTAPDFPASRASILVPLHWASLASAQRMSLTGPFAELSDGLRAGRVVLEIFGIPDDVAARDLADTVRAARLLCREVALRARLTAPKAALAADCGAAAIAVDLAELAPRERTDDPPLLNALSLFREAADKSRLAAYVWGVRHRKVVVGAVQAGFAMVNGPALMKDLVRPAKVLPAPKARFTLS